MSNNNETSETGSSIKVLELHNYHQWSDLMLSYFLEHNLDGIIDGTEEIPDISTPAERNNWMLRQKKAAGFIARKLDSSNRDLFINDDTRRNPQALWNAIQLEYASKKARNRSRLFSRFLSLNCNDGNLSRYTSSFREITREMSNAGVKLDDDLLAHMALHHLPESQSTTKQVIIATSEASNTALTVSGVLNQINELVRDGDSSLNNTSTALNTRVKGKSSTYEKCANGIHNPKTAHPEESCWQTHPEKNPHKTQSNSASITGRALSTLAQKGNTSGKPILDTACSQTMIHDKNLFNSYRSQHTNIEVAGGESISGLGIGQVGGKHKGSSLSFSDCLHVPSLKSNLISMINLAKKGCSIVFKDSGYFEVMQDKDVVLSGHLVNGVMELDISLGESITPAQALATQTNGIVLHRRLGHAGQRPFEKAFPHSIYTKHCDPCVLSKHH